MFRSFILRNSHFAELYMRNLMLNGRSFNVSCNVESIYIEVDIRRGDLSDGEMPLEGWLA